MRLGLITYNYNHLKTEQVMLGLHQAGCGPFDVFALPFVPRKTRDTAFSHRPDMASGAHTHDLSSAFGHTYIPVDSPDDIPVDYDAMIVTGAGILPEGLVSNVKIINAHAGLIPSVRGLDSFKWAIYDRMPLGVTLHLIDKDVDAGEVLASVRTPIFRTDTVEGVARRHYEIEIFLLVRFLEYLHTPQGSGADLAERPARMRMPLETEREMLEMFDSYRDQFCVR